MSAKDGGRLRNTLYRTSTRSGRRMTPARRLLYAIVVPLAIGLIHTWWRLCRVVRIEGLAHLEEALARAPSLVPCYWHQHQLYCGKFLIEQRTRGLTPGWLISPSVDGELGAMMVRRFGGAVIRGSSTHTGARALRDYYQALVREISRRSSPRMGRVDRASSSSPGRCCSRRCPVGRSCRCPTRPRAPGSSSGTGSSSQCLSRASRSPSGLRSTCRG
jgi:Domain of unknown function (DUF374)